MPAQRDSSGRFVKGSGGGTGKGATVTDTDKGWDDVMKAAAKAAAEAPVFDVGLFDAVNASKGIIQEYGAPRAGIKQRSFMGATFDKNRRAYERAMRRHALRIVTPGPDANASAIRAIAEDYEAAVVNAITTWSTPKNADSTEKRKGKNDPLVDTGAMRKAVTTRQKKGVKRVPA